MLQRWAVSRVQLVSLLCSHLTVTVHVTWWVPPSVTGRERENRRPSCLALVCQLHITTLHHASLPVTHRVGRQVGTAIG